jgi:hypothetical protein
MKSVILRVLVILVVAGIFKTAPTYAQVMQNIFGMTEVTLSDYMPTDVTYNSAIPTPVEVLGFEVGHRHVRHDQLVKYMYAVAEASERVTIQEYAKTHGYRPLLLLTVTSPQNQSRINEIRAEHVKLTDPNVSGSVDITSMPIVVWQGFSVHGNEPSGANASLLTLYYLAAAQGPEIDRMLNETVVLLDPSINPDGLDRFAHWANMHVGNTKVSDHNHREHIEVWPNGRTNN